MSRTTKFFLWFFAMGAIIFTGIAAANTNNPSEETPDMTPVSIATVAPATPVPTPMPTPIPTQAPAPVSRAVPDCDPNYSGCVPNVSYDLDCADIGFSVTVIGYDKHGFDRDRDGYGCESY